MDILCRSLFNGNASIGNHYLEEARKNGEDINITYGGKSMTIRPFMFNKFFTYSNKKYVHKGNRSGTYSLQYIQFKPDVTSGVTYV